MTEPAVGASTCASGSHVCTGHIGTLTAKAAKNARKMSTCACSGSGYGQRIGPERKSVDLTPLRGERVFIDAEVRSAHFIGVNFYARLSPGLDVMKTGLAATGHNGNDYWNQYSRDAAPGEHVLERSLLCLSSR